MSERCSAAVQVEVVLTGFECVTLLVCQCRQLLSHLLLSAQTGNSCPPRHWREQKRKLCHPLNTFLHRPVISGYDECVRKRDLLLHSFTGIPSIFALMSLLLFLMAERTASNRNPGHRSSFRISLQETHNHFTKMCNFRDKTFFSEGQQNRTCPHTHTHTGNPPLVVVELLLHQEEVGFELVPLENDVTHLLLGEARQIGILLVSRRLLLRLASCLTWAGLMGEQRVIKSAVV